MIWFLSNQKVSAQVARPVRSITTVFRLSGPIVSTTGLLHRPNGAVRICGGGDIFNSHGVRGETRPLFKLRDPFVMVRHCLPQQ